MAGAVFIVMGVSGSGKTSVGEAIAQQQQVLFIDGDDLHPQANIDKMSRGIPLTDEDRLGWLDTIIQEALAVTGKGEKVVITCSALKQQYRDQLRTGIGSITFLYLKASYQKVFQQLEGRQGHFMPVSLLRSQFALLEEPAQRERDVITIEVQETLDKTITLVLKKLGLI